MSGALPSAATLDLVRTLVGFPTVSRDSNLGLIEWVRDHLARRGVQARLTWDAERRKANLFATLGEGPRPGIVLSGHTDVVPVDGQDWSLDPFRAELREDRLYGRGTADMKGFIGTALAWTDRFLDTPRDHPVHLALSYDEEIGCLGVRGLLADLDAAGIQPAGCIVGEPTGMRAVVAHKGMAGWRCRVRGHAVHSSLTPHGVNAIDYAARLIVRIREVADRLRAQEQRHYGYDVPHSTLNTGRIEGGIALNTVPADCSFQFECRHLPGVDPDALFAEIRTHAERELLPDMRAVSGEAGIAFERIVDLPALDAEAETALVAYAEALAGRGAADEGGRHVAFGTEAGLFQRAGIAAVVCGPGHIAQAHIPDEWIALEQLARCEAFMQGVAEGGAALPARD